MDVFDRENEKVKYMCSFRMGGYIFYLLYPFSPQHKQFLGG